MPVQFEIVTQERLVYSEKVDMVVVDGLDGRLGILPNHSQLLTGLKVSELLVRRGKIEEVFAVSGGVLDVRPDRILVLADTAEHSDEIDLKRADEARKRAEKFLETQWRAAASTAESQLNMMSALRRANVRLRVGRQRRGTLGAMTFEETS